MEPMEISDVFSDPTFGAMLDICRNRKMAESSSPDAISEEGRDMLSRERHENSVRVICAAWVQSVSPRGLRWLTLVALVNPDYAG